MHILCRPKSFVIHEGNRIVGHIHVHDDGLVEVITDRTLMSISGIGGQDETVSIAESDQIKVLIGGKPARIQEKAAKMAGK
jgi:hypothetical protein